MARRRGKNSSKQDESWFPLESPAGQASRGFHEYVIPGVLLLIIAVCGSGLGWVCSDHQHTIESLSEMQASMQARITKLQQQLGTENLQLANVSGFEERLVALEDAYAKAQRQVELALSTSEQIKSKDLQSKVWSLQSEMNDKLEELQQNTISIAALNSIIKNQSIEFEVVKQSVNTMLSANAELAIQISGFASMLSVTKSRLDEQISIVEGLMSQLEGQKRDTTEIKELFASNQESLATNEQELMDIKELLESEQIRRTQNLEKQVRSLYKRLEDHQKNTDSLHFHLAAQLEALQIQFLQEVQQSSKAEEIQGEDQLTTTDNKERETHEIELENTKEFAEEEKIREQNIEKEEDRFNREQAASKSTEEEFSEEEEIREKERVKEEDEFNRAQAASRSTEEEEFAEEEEVREEERAIEEGELKEQTAVEVEASEWYGVEPVKEIQPPSEDSVVNKNAAEEQKEVDVKKEIETLQVTNEIEETDVEDLDYMTMDSGKITDEKVETSVGKDMNIHSETASMIITEPGTQMSNADEIPPHLEDSSTGTTESEEAAPDKPEQFTPAQALQAGSDETDTFADIIDDVFSEEYIEHTEEVLHNFRNEISTTENTPLEDGNAEKESETAVDKDHFPSDKTDNVENQQRDIILAEIEQEAVEELTAASAK